MKARPDQVKFMMVDPKMVELSVYNDIPHLLIPVVTNPRKASKALQKVVDEMENRYELFAKIGVRNIAGFNAKVEEFNAQSEYKQVPLPLIVVIVDELADLMMVASKEVEDAIIRLGQKARAAGIHMILATQRPSVDVISGLIKANVPSRVAFAVSSGTDSRTILDENGAEKLLVCKAPLSRMMMLSVLLALSRLRRMLTMMKALILERFLRQKVSLSQEMKVEIRYLKRLRLWSLKLKKRAHP